MHNYFTNIGSKGHCSEQQNLLDASDNEENVDESHQQNRKDKRKRRRKLVTAKVLFVFGTVNGKVFILHLFIAE